MASSRAKPGRRPAVAVVPRASPRTHDLDSHVNRRSRHAVQRDQTQARVVAGSAPRPPARRTPRVQLGRGLRARPGHGARRVQEEGEVPLAEPRVLRVPGRAGRFRGRHANRDRPGPDAHPHGRCRSRGRRRRRSGAARSARGASAPPSSARTAAPCRASAVREGTFVARSDYTLAPKAGAAATKAVVLLTFDDRRDGRGCLDVRMTQRGDEAAAGRYVLLGGTKTTARLAAGGPVRYAGSDQGDLRVVTRVRTRAAASRNLPPRCTRLLAGPRVATR